MHQSQMLSYQISSNQHDLKRQGVKQGLKHAVTSQRLAREYRYISSTPPFEPLAHSQKKTISPSSQHLIISYDILSTRKVKHCLEFIHHRATMQPPLPDHNFMKPFNRYANTTIAHQPNRIIPLQSNLIATSVLRQIVA